jgi:acetyl-CoA carboxylase biotin carboxyl carrier protein
VPRPAWLAEVRRILEHVDASDATEVELARGTFRLRIKRRPGARFVPAAQVVAPEGAAAAGAAVPAPLTGVFYRAPAPGTPPYVSEGDPVQPDTVVGLIETMKIFNEVLAERRGVVLTILAESGQLVQAGDRLMLIDEEAAAEGQVES